MAAAAAALTLVFAGAAPAATVRSLEKAAFAKLSSAEKRGAIDASTASSARAEVARAAHLIRTLPNGRGYHVQVALQEAASFHAALTIPRVLALYGALRANDDYFAKHWAPADKTDIVGADGVVYRYFGGYCFRFHPLANFGALNAHVAEGDAEGTQALADALIARGVYQRGGGIAWEYDFPFSGGRAPWLSGMAQAVAAQAFAGAAGLVTDRATAYMKEAAAAYRIIPRRLLTSVAAGPWIRLYSFTGLQVLNADLQATISLQSYAAAAGDSSAAALATRMQNAAAATLPRFDTGYWSYYSLPHEPSPVDYHEYVVQLLKKLAATDPRFADASKRFAAYVKEPPAFQLANGAVGQVRFWLSKPASVRVDTNAGPTKSLSLLGGWHTLTYAPRSSGVFPVHVTATDWLGNRAQFDALPIVHVGGKAGSALKVATGANTESPSPSFVVGRRATVVWPDGATAPDPTTVVAPLAAVPAGTSLLVELDAATTPTSAFAQYAAALAQQVPTLKYLVVGPAPTSATAAQYASTVAAVRSAVAAVAPAVAVGALVDGATAPRQTVAALGRAGIGPSSSVLLFRAAAAVATGAWTSPNYQLLTQAFGTLPPLLLDSPNVDALNAAACSTKIAGVVLDPATADTSVAAAAQAAARGTIVCPGIATAAATTALTFPTAVTSGVPVSLQLGCVHDCLYVVTLVGADGRPIVATRGALQGGAAPATVTLPKTTLGQASYTVDVRLANRINPGPAVDLASTPLPRG
jgi:hypothetical protein